MVKNLINGSGAASWLRLAIYAGITLLALGTLYGGSSGKIETNTSGIKQNSVRIEKYLDTVTNIDRRLARLEGALGVDKVRNP